MAWNVEISHDAQRDLDRLDRQAAKRILTFLYTRVKPLDDPRAIGEALDGKLGQYWKYRVGDYRVICEIEDKAIKIIVVNVGNRREVYR